MDQDLAVFRSEDPIEWHLNYWITLEVIGILHGEDPILMAFRIETEIYNIADRQIRCNVHGQWSEYRATNYEPCLEYWEPVSGEDEEVQPYFRDLDRMLVNKEQKAKDRLRDMEELMISLVRGAQLQQARETLENIGQVYQKLHEEEIADAQANTPHPNDTSRPHRKRRYEEIYEDDVC